MSSPHPIPFLLSLLFDALFGDPPNRFHPVAWMGSVISWLKDLAPEKGKLAQLIYGGLISLGGGSLTALLGHGIMYLIRRIPRALGWVLEAALVKSTFSLGGLQRAAGEVEKALAEDDLPQARKAVHFHLVSRDTSRLGRSQVAAAAIESVAENASDGVLAPLFYYTLGGLPGALLYRFLNTADSMLGYRDEAREWLGKLPARLDDLVNFLPARLTGVCLSVAAHLRFGQGKQAWRAMRREARKTDSPNAGVPMSAMAGGLDIELEKVEQYTLGQGNRPPEVKDIQRAQEMLTWGALIGSGTFFVWMLIQSSRKA